MARFEDIHAGAIRPTREMQVGERWRVMVREPLTVSQLDEPVSNDAITIVEYEACRDGVLRLCEGHHAVVKDWNERHRHTPDDAFSLDSIFRHGR